MTRTFFISFSLLFAAALLLGCGAGKKAASGGKGKNDPTAGAGEEGHGHSEEPQHGGALLEVGAHVAHLEFVHDPKEGSATVYISGADVKTPLAIADAPKINLQSDAGPKSLQTVAVDAKDGKASQFSVTDEALKSDPLKGVIVITIDGKAYRPDIKEGHDHAGHEGHDHGEAEKHEGTDLHKDGEHDGHDHEH